MIAPKNENDRKIAFLCIFACLCVYLASCGGGSPSNPPPAPQKTATGVAVTFISTSLNPASAITVRCLIGLPLQLKATESYSDGSSIDITDSANWISSASTTATISAQGSASCLLPGTFNATVSRPGDCSTGCSIAPLNGIEAAQYFGVSLSITAPAQSVAVGSSMQLSASEVEITASGQSTVDVTSTVSWNSLTPTLALVSSTGNVTGVVEGSASIQAAVSDPSVSPATASINVIATTTNTINLSGLAQNQVVAPGSTVTLNFSMSSGDTAPVLLTPFSDAFVASGAPPAATFLVPDSYIGHAALLPMALDPHGNPVAGTELDIDVEPSVFPALSVSPSALQMRFIGDQRSLFLSTQSGAFAGAYLNDSTIVSYSVADLTKAFIDSKGGVTAVGPGSTAITITSGSQTLTVSVSTPSLKRGDFDGNGIIDSNDVSILSQYLGMKATTTNDARDLNGDGVINALDVAIEEGLCGSMCQQ